MPGALPNSCNCSSCTHLHAVGAELQRQHQKGGAASPNSCDWPWTCWHAIGPALRPTSTGACLRRSQFTRAGPCAFANASARAGSPKSDRAAMSNSCNAHSCPHFRGVCAELRPQCQEGDALPVPCDCRSCTHLHGVGGAELGAAALAPKGASCIAQLVRLEGLQPFARHGGGATTPASKERSYIP
jgi:hypothetical protein